MPKLTFEECAKAHKDMWTWLSKNPNKQKEDWPEWEETNERKSDSNTSYGVYKGDSIPYLCFACYWACGDNRGYVGDDAHNKRDCTKCPIEWLSEDPYDSNDCVCTEDYSYYVMWQDAEEDKDAIKYASLIAKETWTDEFTVQNTEISHEDQSSDEL